MSEVRICYATKDWKVARLHAYRSGEGGVRDDNHVEDIVRCFCSGRNGAEVVRSAPEPGDSVLFEVILRVSNTRRGNSTYSGWEYVRHEGCPFDVARDGMLVYQRIKRLLRAARNEKERSK